MLLVVLIVLIFAAFSGNVYLYMGRQKQASETEEVSETSEALKTSEAPAPSADKEGSTT